MEKSVRAKEVRALKKIERDDEILADYIAESGKFAVTKTRGALLRLKFGFSCQCSLCTSGNPQNDVLRVRLQQLSRIVQRSVDLQKAATAALEKCQILQTCNDLIHELPMAYLELYELLHKLEQSGFEIKSIGNLESNPEFYKEKSWEIIKQTNLAHSKAAFTTRMRNLLQAHVRP